IPDLILVDASFTLGQLLGSDLTGHASRCHIRCVGPLSSKCSNDTEHALGAQDRLTSKVPLYGWFKCVDDSLVKRVGTIGGMLEIGTKDQASLPDIVHDGFGHQTEVAHSYPIGGWLNAPCIFQCSYSSVQLGCATDATNTWDNDQDIGRCSTNQNLLVSPVH